MKGILSLSAILLGALSALGLTSTGAAISSSSGVSSSSSIPTTLSTSTSSSITDSLQTSSTSSPMAEASTSRLFAVSSVPAFRNMSSLPIGNDLLTSPSDKIGTSNSDQQSTLYSSQSALLPSNNNSAPAISAPAAQYPTPLQEFTVIPDVHLQWKTNTPGTSDVYYTLVPPAGPNKSSVSIEDDAMTTTHNIDISNLISDTTYYVYVLSSDASGTLLFSRSTQLSIPGSEAQPGSVPTIVIQ